MRITGRLARLVPSEIVFFVQNLALAQAKAPEPNRFMTGSIELRSPLDWRKNRPIKNADTDPHTLALVPMITPFTAPNTNPEAISSGVLGS